MDVYTQCLTELLCVKANYGNIEKELECVKTPISLCAVNGILNDPEFLEECYRDVGRQICEVALHQTCIVWCGQEDGRIDLECYQKCMNGVFRRVRTKALDESGHLRE